jgi:hypothetical protein
MWCSVHAYLEPPSLARVAEFVHSPEVSSSVNWLVAGMRLVQAGQLVRHPKAGAPKTEL